MYPFNPGKQYRRKDVYKIIGIPEETKGGNWDTGYNQFNDDFFIFTNVGVAGRTGHDYGNFYDGPYLHWYAKKNTHLRQNQIQKLINPPGYVYIFVRTDNDLPFTYTGIGKVHSYKNESPVQITWYTLSESEIAPDFPDPIEITGTFREGSAIKRTSTHFERNPLARKACLEHYGYDCIICKFNFETVYGEIGKGFIHVHHLKEISEIGEEYEVDPIQDLRPVCPNCHAMLHRRKPAYHLNEISAVSLESH